MLPSSDLLGCVDTQAVLEREVGALSGLGWIGKNTCLIDQKRGSFFFISEILTTFEIEPDRPIVDHCGTCTRCLEACPTQALLSPYELDATKCISYWTIEHDGEPPTELSKKFSNNIFGCDICQDVCPWNHLARKNSTLPGPISRGIQNINEFLNKTSAQLEKEIKGTALERAGPEH